MGKYKVPRGRGGGCEHEKARKLPGKGDIRDRTNQKDRNSTGEHGRKRREVTGTHQLRI